MKMSGILPKFLAVLGLSLALAGCGVNAIPTKDEAVKARWGDVQAAYQRRSDLVPIWFQRCRHSPRRRRPCSSR